MRVRLSVYTVDLIQFDMAYRQEDGDHSNLRKGINALQRSGDLSETLPHALRRASDFVAGFCHPKGPGVCDHNDIERAVNLATSLPYVYIGQKISRQRKSKPGRLWGTSIAGVGMGSLTFHSTFGHWKPFGRSIDYQLIALSSAALLRAAQDGVPKYVTAAAIALTPFQPLVVTSTNLAALEVVYHNHAKKHPKLQKMQHRHLAAGALGAACFVLEDLYPKFPFVHATWHCLSAYGIATTEPLVAHKELLHRTESM